MEHIREEQLALYAGGDLPPHENSTVAAHLRGCSECRKALAEFQETRGSVISALQNPEAGELAEVRIRLAAELSYKGGERRWAWWMAGAAAALALLFLPHSVQHKIVAARKGQLITALPPVTETASSRLTAEAPHVLRAVSHKKRLRLREAGIRMVSLIAQADQSPAIKMTTADPNVVILWQTDEGTGQEQ